MFGLMELDEIVVDGVMVLRACSKTD